MQRQGMRLAKKSSAAALIVAGLTVLAVCGTATAGKQGSNAVVSDPKDSGKLYPKETYARCDISEVKAQVKRGNKLVVKTTLRGKQQGVGIYLNLNTKGSKSSDPEYVAYGETMFKTGGVGESGQYENQKVINRAVTAKLKNRDRAVQQEVKLKKVGKPKSIGFQSQTCGEGAVDLAPGKNHFDDTSYTGRPDYQFKKIKTSG